MSDINLGGWKTLTLERDNLIGKETEIHSFPLGDWRPHDLTPECWCKPRLIQPDHWMHHSLDDRESYEEGRKLQ